MLKKEGKVFGCQLQAESGEVPLRVLSTRGGLGVKVGVRANRVGETQTIPGLEVAREEGACAGNLDKKIAVGKR